MNQGNLPTSSIKRKDELLLQIFLLILCVLPLIISLFLKTDGRTTAFWFQKELHGIGMPCPFKVVLGINCPSCGATRSFIYMSDLDIKSAWLMNRAAVLLYIFLVLQIPIRLMAVIGKEMPHERAIGIYQTVSLIIIGLVCIYGFVAQFWV